jgi:hypothetical protein
MLTTRNISLPSLNKRDVKIINKKISSHMKRTLVVSNLLVMNFRSFVPTGILLKIHDYLFRKKIIQTDSSKKSPYITSVSLVGVHIHNYGSSDERFSVISRTAHPISGRNAFVFFS